MTGDLRLDDLDRIQARNRWLIARTAAAAGLKAVTLGEESLDALIETIADGYRLSEADRERLRPARSLELHAGALQAAGLLRATPGAGKLARIAGRARRSGQLLATGRALATGGLRAAKTTAKSSKATRLAAKGAGAGLPWLRIATAAYGLGTAAFFAHRARAFDQAAHDLLHRRLAGANI